ncbi:amino acid ABC transporter substrate-binding protein [Bosea sp. Root381]|uniref:ABC transporter substrate-binding protein n=1 Tax=Bosea sp. Root381 TaxID=1736524 RepID=UPI0006FFE7A2|nr:ABC transporter substrate-binding protein [Bosea sp. Root381]KRE18221.1 amino acid ABC transporter substrate-binding protein [Bosea sp. Root381]
MTQPAAPTRRTLLALAAAAAAASPASGAAGSGVGGTRVATVDWAVLETLLALGITPVAATELLQFREVAVEPAVPASVADLGLRGTVNFEMLQLVRPELIFISNFYASSAERLGLIAPVESFTIYAQGVAPFSAAEAMTLAIGRRLGAEAAAQRFVAETKAEFAGLRGRIAALGGRPVIPINLGDARHFRVFGADSMFGEVLARLGVANAWTQATSYSAMAPVGLEALARIPEAWIVVIPPVPEDATRILGRSAFWNALPNVVAGRVLTLEPVNPFGALPAARRFARLLVAAIERYAGAARG